MWPIRLKGSLYILHLLICLCTYLYRHIHKYTIVYKEACSLNINSENWGEWDIFPLILFFCSRKLIATIIKINIQFSSVAQLCPTLCDPMNRSMPGLTVHHQHPEFTQTHVHRVSDAIQPSHPLSSPSPPAPNPSQHQSLFQ